MKQIPLFIDAKNRYFYFSEDDVECDSCGKVVSDLLYVRVQWGSRSEIGLLCPTCMKDAAKSKFNSSRMEEWILAGLTISYKNDFTPVIINYPGMQDSDRISTVFDGYSLKSENTVNKTKYADMESWKGAKVSIPCNVDLVALEAPLKSDLQIINVLDEIARDELVLPDVIDDVKKLEEGK